VSVSAQGLYTSKCASRGQFDVALNVSMLDGLSRASPGLPAGLGAQAVPIGHEPRPHPRGLRLLKYMRSSGACKERSGNSSGFPSFRWHVPCAWAACCRCSSPASSYPIQPWQVEPCPVPMLVCGRMSLVKCSSKPTGTLRKPYGGQLCEACPAACLSAGAWTLNRMGCLLYRPAIGTGVSS